VLGLREYGGCIPGIAAPVAAAAPI